MKQSHVRLCSLCRKSGHYRLTCKEKDSPTALPGLIAPAAFGKGRFVIFALVDSRRPDDFRYIGRSKNGIENAVDIVRYARRGDKGKLYSWIRSLFALKAPVKVKILEEVTKETAKARLKHWIESHGDKLLNAKLSKPTRKLLRQRQKSPSGTGRKLGRIAGMSEVGHQ